MDSHSSRARLTKRAALALLALWVVGVMVWTAGFPWVWDDRALVEPDSATLDALHTAWTEDFWHLAAEDSVHDSGMYRPVVHTTYIVERALTGGSPAFGHVVNVALHGLAALLAALLAVRLGGPGWLAGAVLLLHPYTAEPVANIAARTDVLSTVFLLGALLVVVPAWTERFAGAGWSRAIASAALVLLAGLSKEVGLVAPALFVVVAWARRVRTADLARASAPAIAGAAVAVVLRALALDGGLPAGAPDPVASLASSGWVFLDLVAPVQALSGPWLPPRSAVPGLLVLVGILGLGAAWARAGSREAAACIAWVLAAWLPMADWLGAGVRDSRALVYLPLAGAAVLFAAAVARIVGRPRRLVLTAIVPLLLLFGLLQIGAVGLWSSDLSLWERAVSINPNDPLPRINYARAQAEAGNVVVARAVYEDAARLAFEREDAARYEIAATSVAGLALLGGDLRDARAWYERALAVVGPEGSPTAVRGLDRVRSLEQRSKAPYTPPPAPSSPDVP